MELVLNFFKNHYKTLLKIAFGLFVLYYLIFFLTPKLQMVQEDRDKLKTLNTTIKQIEKNQLKLDSNIQGFTNKIEELDNHIDRIKGQKTTIKEIYYEKINNVDKLSNLGIDSFFTNRYY